jgi:hypothetical protein
MINTSLDDILAQCMNKNNNIRQEGELMIDTLATNNFGDLLTQCAIFLADESKIVQHRQLCATLIKNLINYIPKHQGKWTQLPEDQKLNIKNYTISCLASDNKDIRKASGLTVAGNLL